LAVVHAAQAKQSGVGIADIEEPIVQASVTAFESSVSTFSQNTQDLEALMQERGESYLNAAVVYENLVYESRQQEIDIIPIYPYEGSFVADFPACLNALASEDKLLGSSKFRMFLLDQAGQQLALEKGLRPASPDISTQQSNESVFSADQPQVVFANPNIETIYAIQGLWQSSRKAVNLVMVIDTSGSMQGIKLDSVKHAATDFVQSMGDSDFITILYYDGENNVVPLINHTRIRNKREIIISEINGLDDYRGTPLYDSIGISTEMIAETTSSQTTNTIVILTDGLDTASSQYDLNQDLIDKAMGNNTTIYSIAFGDDADEALLQDLAFRANGNFYRGTEANIAAIYEEMSVLFGGSAGIGR
jgi:Ca-activated chloride channel family protein